MNKKSLANLTHRFKKGMTPWNKGLTAKTSEGMKKISDSKKGDKHPLWKGGRAKAGSYIKIKMPEHPDATIEGYVLEHRLVMENYLKRRLLPFEEVHHRNGVKDDNAIENLELVLKYKHYGQIECPYCKKEFKIK